MFNAKVGYSYTTMRRDGDVIHVRTETTMKINRAGANVEMISIESSRETIDGKPLGFFSSLNLGSAPVRKKGFSKMTRYGSRPSNLAGRKPTNMILIGAAS